MIDGLELDHLFVCAPGGAGDVPLLTGRGLEVGVRRVHRGQGTTNACFFFNNAYLELLWLRDEAEVRSPAVAPLCLWERARWRETGACPLGIAFRLRDSSAPWPLPAWDYAPPFLPPGNCLPIVTPPGAAGEPLVFFSAGSPGPPSAYPAEQRVPLVHNGRQLTLRKVYLETPADALSAEVRRIEQTGLVSIQRGSLYHMRLEFDGAGEEEDFRPALPLSLQW